MFSYQKCWQITQMERRSAGASGCLIALSKVCKTVEHPLTQELTRELTGAARLKGIVLQTFLTRQNISSVTLKSSA